MTFYHTEKPTAPSMPKNNNKNRKYDHVIHLSKSDIFIKVTYPESNPENYLSDITNTMAYIGLFDHIIK